MRKKQLLAVSLAAALVLASLSACGGSTSETADSSAQTEAAAEDTETAAPPPSP